MFSGSSFDIFFFRMKSKTIQNLLIAQQSTQFQGHANNLSQCRLNRVMQWLFQIHLSKPSDLEVQEPFCQIDWSLLSSVCLAGKATCYSPTENQISFFTFLLSVVLTAYIALTAIWCRINGNSATETVTTKNMCQCVLGDRYYAKNLMYLRSSTSLSYPLRERQYPV